MPGVDARFVAPLGSVSPWAEAIAGWTASLRAAGSSENTITLYRNRVQNVAFEHADPWAITTRQLEVFSGDLSRAPATRKTYRSALGSFYAWAVRHEIAADNPAARLPTVKMSKGKPRPISDDALEAALGRAEYRERIMLLFGALAGLRCCEIARVNALDLDGDMLLVHGKGSKERWVPVEDFRLVKAIKAAAGTPGGWVFPNGRGSHIAPQHVSKLLGRVIDRPWTAHSLRHRFATRVYQATGDLFVVAELLGHESIETTKVYAQMSRDRLREAARTAA